MREDQRFEIERALDLLPHVIGGSWTMVWFRMKGVKNPTKTEFREKVQKPKPASSRDKRQRII